MSRNRRNKRSLKKVTDVISSKTFIIILSILVAIIIICLGTIFYRNYQDRQLLARQREELDKEIEDIFSETVQSIANSNDSKRESIIRLSAVGDILCGDEMLKDAYDKSSDTYNFMPMLQNVSGFLKRSDIVVGTMETNFTDNEYAGYGNKRNSPKEFAQAVKESGVNFASLSTNHNLDLGKKGLQETKNYLQELGYDTVGDSLGENRVTIKTIKDTKLAFLSYTYGVENQSSKSKDDLKAINIYSNKKAKEDLVYAEENADFTFVIMHWGEPYATKQSKNQEKTADFLIENGADVILGNHPAAIQPMEVKQNKEGDNVFIAYSLGNYISSINNDTSKVELVLNIQLRKNSEDGKVVLSKVDYTPIYVLDNGERAKNRYELIDMKGVAKAYANGENVGIDRKTYNKLLDGLKLLKKVIGEQNEE